MGRKMNMTPEEVEAHFKTLDGSLLGVSE